MALESIVVNHVFLSSAPTKGPTNWTITKIQANNCLRLTCISKKLSQTRAELLALCIHVFSCVSVLLAALSPSHTVIRDCSLSR